MADDLESIELRPVVANDQVVPDDYEVIWRGLTIGRMMKQADSAHWWWSCNVHGQPPTANDRGLAINFKDSQLRFKLAWKKIRAALRGRYRYRTIARGNPAWRFPKNKMRERCLICKASAPRRGTGY
jgi:hypothetical protein